jgi:hypothetical protein
MDKVSLHGEVHRTRTIMGECIQKAEEIVIGGLTMAHSDIGRGMGS